MVQNTIIGSMVNARPPALFSSRPCLRNANVETSAAPVLPVASSSTLPQQIHLPRPWPRPASTSGQFYSAPIPLASTPSSPPELPIPASLPTRESRPSTGITNDCEHPELHNAATRIESAIIGTAEEELGGGDEVREKLRAFFNSAKELQLYLREKGEVHCFITCPASDSGKGHNLLPVLSTLFQSAFRTSNRGSTVAIQAMGDAFAIARKIALGNSERDQAPMGGPRESSISLPLWFPSTSSANAPPGRPQYIMCRSDIIAKLERLHVNRLADIYSTFFNALWESGKSLKRVNGKIVYASMTPPWLTNSTIFMHGPNRNVSLPFTMSTLPSKNQVRARGKRMLGCAILDAWMKKEAGSSTFLTSLLRKEGIALCDNDESSSTIDLTRPHPMDVIGDSSQRGAGNSDGSMCPPMQSQIDQSHLRSPQ